MKNIDWINGKFEETDIDYKIAGKNILWKDEVEYLPKGVELLWEKIKPKSVLEFGFGMGWTATEFQKHNVKRHVILEPNKENYQMALEWKKQYNTDIEILNIFSWDFETDEKFDLVYDDRQQFTTKDDEIHFKHMKKILKKEQWYARNASIVTKTCVENTDGEQTYYTLNNKRYIQGLIKWPSMV
jgi:16S rRNA G966 N2-methylase RsmD